MKNLKKIISILMICLTISVAIPTQFSYSVITVEAHSGRTDRFGGHHDYKNRSGLGNYHYHHGYPAHLHKNGVCPYAGMSSISPSSTTDTNASNSNMATNNNSNSSNSTQANVESATTNTSTITQTIKISDTSYDNIAFNTSYYANHNSDVYEVYGDNAKALYNHFITSGITEGRQSSEQFCITVYKNNNQDLIDVFGDDLIKYYNHFIECGCKENRVAK